MIMNDAFSFYMGRLSASLTYGFSEGHKIIRMVCDCALHDDSLTLEQFNSIIKRATVAHIKLMEDNYNDGWS